MVLIGADKKVIKVKFSQFYMLYMSSVVEIQHFADQLRVGINQVKFG